MYAGSIRYHQAHIPLAKRTNGIHEQLLLQVVRHQAWSFIREMDKQLLQDVTIITIIISPSSCMPPSCVQNFSSFLGHLVQIVITPLSWSCNLVLLALVKGIVTSTRHVLGPYRSYDTSIPFLFPTRVCNTYECSTCTFAIQKEQRTRSSYSSYAVEKY